MTSIETGIPSPFTYPTVTPETLKEVMASTGAKSVFICISDEDSTHKCDPDKCQAHYMNINMVGFSQHQILGIANTIANSCYHKLVEMTDEEIASFKQESGRK